MTVLVRVEQTCWACPSQWDAWDEDGNYWYLRYRHSRGTAEMQPSSNTGTWMHKTPEFMFEADRGPYDGLIELTEFCELAGLELRLT